MIQKESLSDDALMPLYSMDKYLKNCSQMNPMEFQKQSMNLQQPNINYNLGYSKNKEDVVDEHLRYKASFNMDHGNAAQFNYIGHQFNRHPAPAIDVAQYIDSLSINQLYIIANNVQPIDKLTLPVNNGNLLGPFHLPSDQLVTEVEFHLTEDSLKQINIREDLDVVFLSRFTKENSLKMLLWPSSVKISINDTLLTLDMTMFNKIPLHSPQFIKSVCFPGRNVVKFELFDFPRFNHQLFQFHIYMVHRPTMAHSKALVMENAIVCDEVTMKLLREGCGTFNRDYTIISTICPITDRRIEVPIRFKDCSHLQPFDLMGFLKVQARWMLNICPLCRKNMFFNFNACQQNIVIDPILQRMFEKTPADCTMIKVDVNGLFAPLYKYLGPEYLHLSAQGNHNGMVAMHHRPMYRNVGPDPKTLVESGPGLQYNPTNAVNRSMLDFVPCHLVTNTGLGNNGNHPSPAKKTTKRKPATKKSTLKVNIEPIVRSNHCQTPPSNTRTSSIASTSSPDSLNVPHSFVPKRSPSIEPFQAHFSSESHLNDELLLYSSASSSTKPVDSKPISSESQLISTSEDRQASFSQTLTYTDQLLHPPQHKNAFLDCASETFLQNGTPAPSVPEAPFDPFNTYTIDQQAANSIIPSSFVEQILTNHEQVPELNECDWLDDFSLLDPDRSIAGLSDMEDF